MRKLLIALACMLVVGLGSGCSVTKQWVIDTAQGIAVGVADKAVEKVNEKYVVPQIEKIEKSLGEKVDKNSDGVWQPDELKEAISKQAKVAIGEATQIWASDTDKKLDEKLKDVATKSDGVKGLVGLIIAYILAKLGIKVGPKGFAGVQSYLDDRKNKKLTDGSDKVDLS
jgi:hypothetical protein